MTRLGITLLSVTLASGGLLAQAGSNQPASKPTSQPSPLSGPKVPDRSGKPTLVERGSDGKVVRIDEWPALAAVRKLKLDEASRKAVAKIDLDQASGMDKFLSENLLEVAAVAAAFESGDWKEGLAALRKLQDNQPALQARGQLAQRLSEVLKKSDADEMRAMVQEYWNALIKEEEQLAKTRGEKASAARVASGEALRLLGADFKASYERVIGQRVQEFDGLIKVLDLSPEQESRVRRIVDDAVAKAKGDPKKVNKSQVFWKVWAELDARQRNTLVGQFAGKGDMK